MKNLFTKAEFKYDKIFNDFKAEFDADYIKQVVNYSKVKNATGKLSCYLQGKLERRQIFEDKSKVRLNVHEVEFVLYHIREFKKTGEWEIVT